MHHSLGTLRNQIQMFCPEQYIEQDNFVRVIDAFVDTIDLNSFGFRHVTTGEDRVNESPNYYRLRLQIAEHPWGTLKRQWAFDYILMKGKRQVLGEVSLAFIGYNLMRSVRIMTPEKFIEKLLHSPFLLQKIQNQKLFLSD